MILGATLTSLALEQHNFLESHAGVVLNTLDLWDDYYEALGNTNINDLVSFFLSYYSTNAPILVLMGFLILIGSVICVNLNRLLKASRVQNFDSFLKMFDFFKNSVSSVFMRQQNLNDQNLQISSTRVFKMSKR